MTCAPQLLSVVLMNESYLHEHLSLLYSLLSGPITKPMIFSELFQYTQETRWWSDLVLFNSSLLSVLLLSHLLLGHVWRCSLGLNDPPDRWFPSVISHRFVWGRVKTLMAFWSWAAVRRKVWCRPTLWRRSETHLFKAPAQYMISSRFTDKTEVWNDCLNLS